MLRLLTAFSIATIVLLLQIESDNSLYAGEGDEMGFSCSSTPCTRDNRGMNVCCGVSKKNYPGLLMIVAKKATIVKCRKANALDYGHEYGRSCYDQCPKATACFPYAG